MENMENLEAEGRRVFDPISLNFDGGNRRCTDLVENTKVVLPKPCDKYTESSIEVIKDRVMRVFEN